MEKGRGRGKGDDCLSHEEGGLNPPIGKRVPRVLEFLCKTVDLRYVC